MCKLVLMVLPFQKLLLLHGFINHVHKFAYFCNEKSSARTQSKIFTISMTSITSVTTNNSNIKFKHASIILVYSTAHTRIIIHVQHLNVKRLLFLPSYSSLLKPFTKQSQDENLSLLAQLLLSLTYFLSLYLSLARSFAV